MKAGALRLLRGSSVFLADATEWVAEAAGGPVLSPALYPSATRVWERSGYGELLRLSVMEKPIRAAGATPEWITATDAPDFEELETIDRSAFDTFWHMGAPGISEAFDATTRSIVVEARHRQALTGYALVGARSGICFLQRIAVDPNHRGNHLGMAMIEAAESWARQLGASTMILNVRPDNEPARDLYFRTGFKDTGAELRVLSYPADSLI